MFLNATGPSATKERRLQSQHIHITGVADVIYYPIKAQTVSTLTLLAEYDTRDVAVYQQWQGKAVWITLSVASVSSSNCMYIFGLSPVDTTVWFP